MCPTQRLRIRRQVAEMLRHKKQASLDIFLEVENMELEFERVFAANSSWARSCWDGTWADDVYGAWKKQVFNASSCRRERSAAN